MSSLFLGFDLSTQQLKIVSCYEDLSFHSKFSINFDEFSQKYNTTKGVLSNQETGEVVTPVALFIEAIQTLLDRMKSSNFPFDKVKSISGSCQQHGTVYYTSKISESLSRLNGKSDHWSMDLEDSFSFPNASNWQDRSTVEEAKDFENALGSAAKLCQVTGSKAHYRFSGLQIRRRAKSQCKEWKETTNVGLISSFLDTFLSGKLRGIEIGEACGTNLFDILKNDWNDELLSLILMKNCKIDGVDEQEQIEASKKARMMLSGNVVKPDNYSKIAPYLIDRYGFNKECIIWPITGDNLATIMSLPLKRDDLLVSMGTSTTVLLLTEKYVPSVNYHLFKHPVCPNIYMGMLCYCNGALAREQIRDEVNKKYGTSGWDKFDEILDNRYFKEIGNEDGENKVGIYFPLGEIIPNAKACKRIFTYSKGKGLVELTSKENKVSIEEESLLIIESQALSCRLRVCPMLGEKNIGELDAIKSKALEDLREIVGNKVQVDKVSYDSMEFIKRPNNVYYVGGSSQNESIVRVFNDILGCKEEGYRVEIGDACALGGCFRAIWGSTTTGSSSSSSSNGIGFEEWIREKFDFENNVEKIERDENEVEKRWGLYFKKVGLLSLCEKELV